MFNKLAALVTGAAISLSFAASAFAQSNDWVNAIHGKWRCDVEKTVKLFKDSELSSQRLDLVREFLPTVTLELTNQGAMSMAMGADETRKEREATYKTADTDEEEKTIEIKVLLTGEKSENGGEITILDENTIKLVTDDGSVPLILVRVKEKEEASSIDD